MCIFSSQNQNIIKKQNIINVVKSFLKLFNPRKREKNELNFLKHKKKSITYQKKPKNNKF